MQALQQYIDLYREHHEVIDRHSSAVLNALRPEALQAIERNGLPTTRHEDYHHTDLEAMFAPDFGLNITQPLYSAILSRRRQLLPQRA